jgi:hypothetical protein
MIKFMSDLPTNATAANEAGKGNEFPSPERFFLKVPLYESHEVNSANYLNVVRTQFFKGTMDAYCIGCEQHSIFRDTNDYTNYTEEYALNNRIFSVELICTRENSHSLLFIFKVHEGMIQKIGQSPSIADFDSADIGKYRKILGEEKYREFKRAIGLVAHGVGIGSFIYLRRIFEHLIEEEHQEAKKSQDWDEQQYLDSRMDEKILFLQNSLPAFLVENRKLYSVLSKAVHSLSEEECLKLFAPIKMGIELILDERIEQKEKRTKIEEAKKVIADIVKKLN